MIRFYPDTNVVHLLEQTWTPEAFDARARAADHVLALGFHVIYELARGFGRPARRPAVSAACRFLSAIQRLEFQPDIHAIVRADFHRAVTGLELVTVLSPANQLLTRQEIVMMAAGRTAAAALPFIEKRESRTRLYHPQTALANMRSIRSALDGNALARRLCRTFQGFRQYMSLTAPPMLRRLASGQRVRVTEPGIRLILADHERFPVVTTWLNAQWYLMWVSTMYQNVPARDKLDDFRHLTESARCDVFVTAERGLLKRAHDIRPFRPTISWDDLRARLSLR